MNTSSMEARAKASRSSPVPKRYATTWFLMSPHRRTATVPAPTTTAARRMRRSAEAGAAVRTESGSPPSARMARAPGPGRVAPPALDEPVQGAPQPQLEALQAGVGQARARQGHVGQAVVHVAGTELVVDGLHRARDGAALRQGVAQQAEELDQGRRPAQRH